MYLVSSVTTDTTFIRKFDLWYAMYRKRFTIDYLCSLFVGDGVKRQPRQIIRPHVGLKRNMGKSGEVTRNNTKTYITNDDTFLKFPKEYYTNAV
jgi:hypothetical protein